MYFIYLAIIILIPIYAQMKVKSTYKKYSQVPVLQNEWCRDCWAILDQNGLYNVRVEETPGMLSDHYDPRDKTVRLSTDNYHGHSVAGVAVAAHEVDMRYKIRKHMHICVFDMH